MKRFSSLKSFSSKEIKLGGHKNEKEINEQRSFSETNFKYSEGSENKLESLKMSPLPESTNLLPKRLNQSPGKYSPRQKMKSLWQNAVEAGRKTLAKQKSRESQSSIGTINSNNLETLDTESLYFTPVAIFVDENDDDSQKEEKEKSPKKFKRKEQI
uniref:Uncharacterized protein n=1 Tax=Meloidogyne hapla TaxID=6305 RepID=A0A1I8BYV9_MELHA